MTAGSTASHADVTLTLNQQHYTADSLILVTIHNGSQHTIWARDHQTSCTVLALERITQNSWYRVGQCATATPTRAEQYRHVVGGDAYRTALHQIEVTRPAN